jgi:hypothetical protein
MDKLSSFRTLLVVLIIGSLPFANSKLPLTLALFWLVSFLLPQNNDDDLIANI